MTADDVHRWNQPPPPRPRRRNVVVLRLYDAPVYRDPMAWWTAFIAGMSFIAILTSPQSRTSGLPPLLDALLGLVVMAGLFAVIPAAVRLQLRRIVWRRRERRQSGTSGTVGSTVTESAAESTVRIYAPPTGRASAPRPPPPRGAPPQPPSLPRPADPPSGIAPERAGRRGSTRHEDPAGPVPAAVTPPVDDSQTFVAASPELRRAAKLQYPIAVNVRALQVASKPSTRYAAAMDCAEALAMTLGMSTAAWLAATEADQPALTELAKTYGRGVTFGTWTTVLKQVARSAATRGDAPPAVAAFGDGSGSERLSRLGLLLQERNRQAHNSRPRSEVEAERRVAEILPVLVAALEDAAALRQSPWIVTESSSYRVSSRSFDVTARTVMSDHPTFEIAHWTFPSPVADGRAYLVPDGGTPIDLTPFVVFRACETCLTEELFFAAKLSKTGPTELKSFANSHERSDPSLDSEIRALRPTSTA